MVVQRIWNFISRHRKKFIFTGILAGGAYYFLKVKLPKVQEDFFDSLMKELAAGAASSNGQAEEQQRRASFQKHQEVSDSYARKGLRSFLARHQGCFKIDQCHAKVKAASNSEMKVAAFKELQVECLALLASAAYSLNVILMLHRVQFNIAGREAAAGQSGDSSEANGEPSAAMQELISSTDFFLEGPAMVVNATRKAVQETTSLQPETAVSTSSLSSFFKEVFQKVDKDIWADSKGSALLPPDAAGLAKAKPFLDEARDYLESPHLLHVFRSVSNVTAERLPQELAKTGGKASALKEGTVPLATLFGGCITLGKNLFQADPDGTESAEASIRSFADQTVVVFTASAAIYADKVLDWLDPGRRLISYRLYREACTELAGGHFKDLRRLGRSLDDVVLVDNSPLALGLRPENGMLVPVLSFGNVEYLT